MAKKADRPIIEAEPFTGFPPQGFQFLRDLAENNNKEWFEANKAAYQAQVQAPAVAMVAAIGERLQTHFPEIVVDLRTNGSGTLMRHYRDTRFSADKSPYKTNVAMMFTARPGKKMEQPGFGLQLSSDMIELMTGIFNFPKPMLEDYRVAVLNDKRGTALIEAVKKARAAGEGYQIGGETYKRVPKGYDTEHPRADWLKYTGLAIYAPPIPAQEATVPQVIDTIVSHLVAMSPVYQWLTTTLTNPIS